VGWLQTKRRAMDSIGSVHRGDQGDAFPARQSNVYSMLGTRSPPLASYLVQWCPTPADGSGRAAFNVESPIHQETIDAGPRTSLNSRTTSGRIRQQR
jgi:hypothetical protein